MSVPSLNTAVTTDNPWIDSERMDSRLPTPLSSLSMGRVTSASTCSGARPGASDCTVTWGWTNSGKTSSFACAATKIPYPTSTDASAMRSEEHTSELQSPDHIVCRLLLEKKKKQKKNNIRTQ